MTRPRPDHFWHPVQRNLHHLVRQYWQTPYGETACATINDVDPTTSAERTRVAAAIQHRGTQYCFCPGCDRCFDGAYELLAPLRPSSTWSHP